MFTHFGYSLDHFNFGNKYTSPQSQRKMSSDETFIQDKQMLIDESTMSPEYQKTDTMTMKFDPPLDTFKDLNMVYTKVKKLDLLLGAVRQRGLQMVLSCGCPSLTRKFHHLVFKN